MNLETTRFTTTGRPRLTLTLYGNSHSDAVALEPDSDADEQDYKVYLNLRIEDARKFHAALGDWLKVNS